MSEPTPQEVLRYWTERVPPGVVRAYAEPPGGRPFWALYFEFSEGPVLVLDVVREGDMLVRQREIDLEAVRREAPGAGW